MVVVAGWAGRGWLGGYPLASSMNPEEPYDPHKTTAAAGGDVGELLLNNAFPPQKRQQLEVQQVNVPLPPPPGIAPRGKRGENHTFLSQTCSYIILSNVRFCTF